MAKEEVTMRRLIQATACAIGISIVGVSASSAQLASSPNPPLLAQSNDEWMLDVTALVLAPDGTWGTATESTPAQALAKAIANCKRKYRGEIGCGYRSTFIREGWSLVLRCGDENIIVAAKTLHEAEQAAVYSELTLRRDYKPEMPLCTRIVSVKPDGRVIAPDVAGLPRFVKDRTP
jgi:hypothetical protein